MQKITKNNAAISNKIKDFMQLCYKSLFYIICYAIVFFLTNAFSCILPGVLIDFISVPVTVGFTSATSVIIAVSQLKGLLGLKFKSGGFINTMKMVSFKPIFFGFPAHYILRWTERKLQDLRVMQLIDKYLTKVLLSY